MSMYVGKHCEIMYCGIIFCFFSLKFIELKYICPAVTVQKIFYVNSGQQYPAFCVGGKENYAYAAIRT